MRRETLKEIAVLKFAALKIAAPKIAALTLAAALVSGLASGCSGLRETATQTTQQPSGSTGPTTSAPAEPLGRYAQTVTVNVVNSTNSTVQYPAGQTAEDNVWIKAYQETLGIKVNYLWLADDQQYFQKMAVTIASAELPDVFPVNAQQLSDLVESGSLADLTAVYDQYASPLTRQITGQDETVFNLGKRKGRLYALTNTAGASAYDQLPLLYVREDWRKKLNLPEPRTLADFARLADAFTNQDPDGNGQKDTIALSLTRTLMRSDGGTGVQGFGTMAGIANACHAYPTTWLKNDAGQIIYGSIQPEVKVVLQQLQAMYRLGQIDKEFAVKDMAKAAEKATAGEEEWLWPDVEPIRPAAGHR